MKIVIENADANDFNELAKLARQGKIHTFYMTDEEEWIPVSERLPEVSQRCLVYTKYDEVMTDFFMGDEFPDNGFMQGADIIAWRPLPKPYKKGGAE